MAERANGKYQVWKVSSMESIKYGKRR